MNIAKKIVQGHTTVMQAFSLVLHNKRFMLYSLLVMGVYALFIVRHFSCLSEAMSWRSAGAFVGYGLVACIGAILLCNRVLSTIKQRPVAVLARLRIEKTLVAKLAVLIGVYVSVVLLCLMLRTCCLFWYVLARIVSAPLFFIMLFAVFALLDEPTTVGQAIKRACAFLWRRWIVLLAALLELYLIFFVCTFVISLIVGLMYGIAHWFNVIPALLPVQPDNIQAYVAQLFSSPLVIVITGTLATLMFIAGVFFMTMLFAVSAILYDSYTRHEHDEDEQLLITPPM
jgi:hypothetical protein